MTPEGLGAEEALRRFTDVLLPMTTAIDHPRYFAFIPAAPTPASALFDLLVSATSVYGGSWLEGAGAVHAENEALRWLADLAGLPGGRRRLLRPGRDERQPVGAARRARAGARRGAAAARRALARRVQRGGPLLRALGGADHGRGRPARRRRRRRAACAGRRCARRSRAPRTSSRSWPPPARRTSDCSTTSPASPRSAASESCGCTSTAPTARPALCAPSVRGRFAGIEHADSLIVDPHKWLFAPFDSCALLYRDPARGPGRAPPERLLPRRAVPRGGLEPVRLRAAPDPPRPRAAVLVLARRARHRRLRRRRRAHAGGHARGGGGDPRAATSSSCWPSPSCPCSCSAAAAGTTEDYHRWAAELKAAGTAFVLPTTVRRRDRRPARARQPAHDARGPPDRARHDALRYLPGMAETLALDVLVMEEYVPQTRFDNVESQSRSVRRERGWRRTRWGSVPLPRRWEPRLLVLVGPGSVVATLALAGDSTPAITGADLLGISFAFGLVITALVYALGKVSGCHINPAVTFALAVTKRFPWREVPIYWGAQVAGGVVGALGIWAIFASTAIDLGMGQTSFNEDTATYGAGDLRRGASARSCSCSPILGIVDARSPERLRRHRHRRRRGRDHHGHRPDHRRVAEPGARVRARARLRVRRRRDPLGPAGPRLHPARPGRLRARGLRLRRPRRAAGRRAADQDRRHRPRPGDVAPAK